MLNICFCYDLIQTLSNPFEVAKSKLLIYLTISIVIPAIFQIWDMVKYPLACPHNFYKQNIDSEDTSSLIKELTATFTECHLEDVGNRQTYKNSRRFYNIYMSMSLTIFMMVGFYSIIFAYRRLFRPGVSFQMRRMFLKKHGIYVAMLILIQLCQFLINYYELFSNDDKT